MASLRLFKDSVILTPAQAARAYDARNGTPAEQLAARQVLQDEQSSAYAWDLKKIEDYLGFTEMLGKFETVAKALGAVTHINATGRYENNASPAGVPAQMALRLAALQNLKTDTMTMYKNTFETMLAAGTKLKDVRSAALQAAQAIVNTQLKIINTQYPETYTSMVEKGLHAKLKRDQSGLQNF